MALQAQNTLTIISLRGSTRQLPILIPRVCTRKSSSVHTFHPIKKLGKIPFLGTLNEKRVCNAMNKITKAVNTTRTLRASIEFCLGAFRSNIEISTFTEANQQSCFCCGILEKHNSINEAGRNPTFHLRRSGQIS